MLRGRAARAEVHLHERRGAAALPHHEGAQGHRQEVAAQRPLGAVPGAQPVFGLVAPGRLLCRELRRDPRHHFPSQARRRVPFHTDFPAAADCRDQDGPERQFPNLHGRIGEHPAQFPAHPGRVHGEVPAAGAVAEGPEQGLRPGAEPEPGGRLRGHRRQHHASVPHVQNRGRVRGGQQLHQHFRLQEAVVEDQDHRPVVRGGQQVRADEPEVRTRAPHFGTGGERVAALLVLQVLRGRMIHINSTYYFTPHLSMLLQLSSLIWNFYGYSLRLLIKCPVF